VILYVGRFSQLTQNKGQEVLVEVFKKFYKVYRDWKLVLAGGIEVGADDYVKKLEKSAKGYPIEIVKSPTFKEIINLYGRAKIFWSASGFGVNEKRNPLKVEHFGITLVEAMAAGCVPVVYSAGGHKEIIDDGVSGLLWLKKEDLLRKTKNLIKNRSFLKQMSFSAIESAKVYEYERFETEVLQII